MATSDPTLTKRPKTDNDSVAVAAVTTVVSSPSSSLPSLPSSLPSQKATPSITTTTTTTTSPRSIVTWNCNGFVTRCKYNVPELHLLQNKTNQPDMICLQEARLKAKSSTCRGEPMASELNGPVENVLNTVFNEYIPYWSLADSRYAGTLTLLHHKFQTSVQVAYSLDSAMDLLLKHYELTRDQVVGVKASISSSQTKDNNSAGATPKKQQQQQKSISSFFKATAPSSSTKRPSSSNKRPRTTSRKQQQQQQHQEEGRFQFFLFPDKDIVQTYVPNHGMKMEKWEKRKQWDLEVLEFVQQRQLILDHVAKTTDNDNNNNHHHHHHHRTLLWCGDLNVAHTYMDGTDWKKTQNGGEFYEWWTDESKCIIKNKKNVDYYDDDTKSKDPQYVGMPSFTPAERTRFSRFLQIGKLVDVWRQLHPHPCENWNAPHWTWRGHPGPKSPYANRGQRLDYFLLSESDTERVESCRIMGTGNHKGLFCGSDHCVSLLVLKENE
ncbi:unnamed protein product [Cylindrotheca closterium]|uniref:Endonuclease/exonuclease/phosphatase domain-containing protein n=1 Tax=Cylindrotheca closterium TaxID=2856 RepID=A0AAD2FUN1_9STRA|nr:unnamed protein product [Cylindrotheca closterium]